MKIALLGDCHANGEDTYLKIARAAADKADIVVQLGDFAWTGRHYDVFISHLDTWLNEEGLELWWIDGNHDDHDLLDATDPNSETGLRDQTPRIHNIPRGHRWTWGGVDFMGVGGAYSIDKAYRTPHVSWWPQETITLAEVKHAQRPGNVDILFSHDTPWGVQNPYGRMTGGGDKDLWPESKANRYMLRGIVDAVEPDLLFHGHCHHWNEEKLMLDSGHVVEVTGLARDTMSKSYLLIEV